MNLLRSAFLLVTAPALITLGGCSADFGHVDPSALQTPLGAIQGQVHGGRQPVASMHLFVFAAGQSGYGSAAASLLTSVTTGSFPTTQDVTPGSPTLNDYYVTTDANGNFSLGGEYTCTAGTQVYLYGVGGQPSTNTTNGSTGMLAALGTCPASGTMADVTPNVSMNEVSTVAAAFTLTQFATDATHIGASSSALGQTSLANSFTLAGNLDTLYPGVARSNNLAGTATVPQTTINAIANSLAACVNSTGSSSSQCQNLFTYATVNGVAPTDTASAAINIARHPYTNVSSIFTLTNGIGTPFLPTLSAAPNNFALVLTFTGGGMNYPQGIAIDAVGNAWIGGGYSTLTEISASGAFLSGATGFPASGPFQLAIDLDGNVWGSNSNYTTVSKFTSAGVQVTGSPFAAVNQPNGIAVDSLGNAWVVGLVPVGGRGVAKLTPAGAQASGSPFLAGDYARAVTIDTGNNAWIGNNTFPGTINKLSNAGTILATYSPGNYALTPSTLAFDTAGNLWAGSNSQGAGSIMELSPSGAVLNGTSGYYGGTLTSPSRITVDSKANIWVAGASTLSAISSTGAALTGTSGVLSGTFNFVAVDGSGNVWASQSPGTVVEVLGAASPLATPVVAGVKAGCLACLP